MIEIRVVEEWRTGFHTDIYVTNKIGTTRQFLQPDGNWIAVEVSELAVRDDVKPTCRLPMELGKELLQELMNHYHGADDARMLRKDYDAERMRVDKMINALIDLASVE